MSSVKRPGAMCLTSPIAAGRRRSRLAPRAADCWPEGTTSAKISAMAAKKAKKHPRGAPPRGARKSGEDLASLIATALASHESSIAQLAEVVVNLHANVRALRDLVEALAEGASATGPRVAGAKRRLRRVKLDE